MFLRERFWARARKFGPCVGLVDLEETLDAYSEDEVSVGSVELDVVDDSESDSDPESYGL